MSQPALFMITDEGTVIDACRGWLPALREPRTFTHKNPFTGEKIDAKTWAPIKLDKVGDFPPLDEVWRKLEKSRPFCTEFKVHRFISNVLIRTRPFLVGKDEHGAMAKVTRVGEKDESTVLEAFIDQVGELQNVAIRREKELSLFVFVSG